MAGYETVNPPGGASYAPPLMNFSNFANWAADDPYQKLLNQQQQQLNQQRIQQGQQQLDLGRAFPNGLPIDPKTGQVDYKAVAQTFAKFGDPNSAVNVLQQQPPPMSPMLSGGGQPAAPGVGGAAPDSIAAKPLPAPAANSPQGDSGSGTVASIVTDRLPNQDATTGQTIAKVAQTMGVDPNAPLTPGQIRRAQGLVQRYAPGSDAGGGSDTPAPSAPGGGNLPPSANAIAPAPQSTAPASFKDRFAATAPASVAPSQPAPAAPQLQPQPQQPPQGGPIVPQVPLPKGFQDPQQAILALRTEAARLSQNPRAAGQVAELNNWASRIEESIKPVSVGPSTTLVDPRNSRTLYQGPAAAAMGAGGMSPTLDADAERYRQTGQLPPNMGRGMQGSAEAKQIRARAAELEIEHGGDPSNWPDQWQQFRAKGIGLNTGERTKAAREENLNLILKAADAAIPAALEASAKLPRSQYVPLNRLIQKGEIMSSNPQLVEFGMANLQLAEHWARAMNPTGVMRESDRDKALSFLDTAYSNNTYERAVMQLQKQITRERDAVRGGGTSLPSKGSPDPGGTDKDGWVAAPNGAMIREKS